MQCTATLDRSCTGMAERVVSVARGQIIHEVCSVMAGIQILDRRGMLDTSLITEEHILEHERRRCRSLREAIEFLDRSRKVPRVS